VAQRIVGGVSVMRSSIRNPDCTTPCHQRISSRASARDRGCKVELNAHLREHDVEAGVAVEYLDLAVLDIPQVGTGDVDLGAVRLDDSCGRLERPGEGAADRQLDRDDITDDVNP